MKGVILDQTSLGEVNLHAVLNNGDDWQVFTKTAPHQVEERIKQAEIVLSNKVPISETSMATADKLKLIIVMATGTNNVDLTAAKKYGIQVCNVRGYGSASVAQHTLTLMLSLATQLPNYLDDVRQGEWQNRGEFALIHRPIIELSGKRLGIVGYGQLGSSVAKLAEAFGMNVVVAQRLQQGHLEPTNLDSNQVTRLPMDELLSSVDFLSLHCPLTQHNHHMIDREALKIMKPTSFIINTARGGLIDPTALIEALETNVIAGAGLDALEQEPPEQDDALLNAQRFLPNLLVTPHNAWGASESRQRLVDQIAAILQSYHKKKLINIVQPV